jgi:hypothetical protein
MTWTADTSPPTADKGSPYTADGGSPLGPNHPIPWGGDQLWNIRRDEWRIDQYWTQPPQTLPPPPPFEKWVPSAKQFAFAELPQDRTRYQPQVQVLALTQVVPVPPVESGSTVPQFRPDWTLRDYAANQDRFSITATPLLPPKVPLNPQVQPWVNWALRDYSAYQNNFSAIFGARGMARPSGPAFPTLFPEPARDMTALKWALTVNAPIPPPPPSINYVPSPKVFVFADAPKDYFAQRLIILAQNTIGIAFSGIPQVPLGGAFVGFDYEPVDETPYQMVFAQGIPTKAGPQIPPSQIPFIEWPGWTWGQYQALQDQFSAGATPTPSVYPAGVGPQFTPEALLRTPWPYQLPLTFILPPPPPRVIPTPDTILEWRQWGLNEYPLFPDQFSAWIQTIPIPPAFRVRAVTSGWYNGTYYQPGDVFDLLKSTDFSDYTVNYGPLSATQQFGWMLKVTPTTPLFSAEASQPTPIYPIVDPVPPKRFVY